MSNSLDHLRHRWHAARDLIHHYRQVFAHYWKEREQLTPQALLNLQEHEAEFLPAALSLQAKPVSPAARWVARTLMALVLVALLWSVLGTVDIIVNGQGKIVPSERTKTIAAVEIARVRAIHVSEGQAVRAGDLLVELDARASDSDKDKADASWQNARLTIARSQALLSAIANHSTPSLPALANVDADHWAQAQQHLQDQWRDYKAKLERLDSDIQRLSQTLPLVTRQARDYAELAKTNDVSQHAWLEKEQARVDVAGQLSNARNQRSALIAETRRTAQDAATEARRLLDDNLQDMRRASVHSEWMRLTSPVDGTVQQLTVHTVGSAVPAAQPLMQIVPRQHAIEVEAMLENKDIGFVQEGQSAHVKLDPFEYTKYGTLDGTVVHVSRDAIQDEKRGLLYSVLIRLQDSSMRIDGREIPLSAGMGASVEIKTGTRRVIEYVLSPLIQHSRESLRER